MYRFNLKPIKSIYSPKAENMIDRYDVEIFLNDFKFKLDYFGILFRDDRSKNTLTLSELGIISNNRKTILKDLQVEEYSEGPITEALYGNADMWIFGKVVKGREIYIKISMGKPNKETICISFHLAEFPISFPFTN